jgi:guanylate kinase
VPDVDYNFVSRGRFDEMVERGQFLEWADIFGNAYGTAREDTERALAAGNDVILVIDVQGARQVRTRGADAVFVFVLPPSFDVLERRLRGRNQDPDTAIARRLATARAEVSAVNEYDYVIVNDDIDRCVDDLAAIVKAERARRSRRHDEIQSIVETFQP